MKVLFLFQLLITQVKLGKLPLEELLKINVFALKIPAEIKKIPADVIIIDKAEINSLGLRNLTSLISFLAGFYLWNDRTFEDISLRGISSGIRSYTRTVKVLLDGIPLDFKFDGSNFIGDELVSIEAVERIEIVKGPASSLYGKYALLGVINIITKNKETRDFSFNVYEVNSEISFLSEHIRELSEGVRKFNEGAKNEFKNTGGQYEKTKQKKLYYHGVFSNRGDGFGTSKL